MLYLAFDRGDIGDRVLLTYIFNLLTVIISIQFKSLNIFACDS